MLTKEELLDKYIPCSDIKDEETWNKITSRLKSLGFIESGSNKGYNYIKSWPNFTIKSGVFFLTAHSDKVYDRITVEDIIGNQNVEFESRENTFGFPFNHGDRITCKIYGDYISDAKVTIENDSLFICQNEKDGTRCNTLHGYKYSWVVCGERATNKYWKEGSEDVTNVEAHKEPTEKFLNEWDVGTYVVAFKDYTSWLKKGDILRLELTNRAYSITQDVWLVFTDPKSWYSKVVKPFVTLEEAEKYRESLLEFEKSVKSISNPIKPGAGIREQINPANQFSVDDLYDAQYDPYKWTTKKHTLISFDDDIVFKPNKIKVSNKQLIIND